MPDINASRRLLKLKEILFRETDEEHELSMKEIITKLQLEFGEEADFDKRTLKRDIEALNDENFEVIVNTGPHGKAMYSHQARLFETYQLRLMVDAILSARFITEKEKKLLIEKIKQLTSRHIARSLPDPLIYYQSANPDYNLIKLNIDRIHEAISSNHVLHFKYGKHNVKKEFEYHREGSWYDVEPYALIWQNDFYYLIGKFRPTEEFRHYRLDRMRDVTVADEKFRREQLDIKQYIDQSFHMFAGENQWIKIQFHNDLINVVLDRFGLDADIRQVDDEHFLLTTKAKISKGLKGWILTWGHQAKVIAPEWLAGEIKEEIQQMQKLYE
ncbi:putative DNA-binding transcriptional regulator YafY [Melghiribacillus thermohalophilus]|uniref:Putative DNA-binding transcriptional regulator YafY n=1 Tax=Melghiribacillus thermohalophilus TaxID=1324956 RepID=A0A4R3N140_9BACI|nr:WYL domain-containing protein [Melghiribacillus thermohalophilus]TCT21771.1 putative DNA-binding transcriptional regulator YafY [Melghiribacillus thermohalophilus]